MYICLLHFSVSCGLLLLYVHFNIFVLVSECFCCHISVPTCLILPARATCFWRPITQKFTVKYLVPPLVFILTPLPPILGGFWDLGVQAAQREKQCKVCILSLTPDLGKKSHLTNLTVIFLASTPELVRVFYFNFRNILTVDKLEMMTLISLLYFKRKQVPPP